MPIFGNKKEKDVIASMFLTAAIVMIFTQMTGVVATIIDGIVTSRFLGPDQYSAVALLGPLVNIVLLFASFVSIGGQIVCSNKVGTGDRDEANAVFTFSLLFGILVAAAFVTFSIISPGTLLQICGVSHKGRPELYEHMLDYLHGYTIGIPAVIMVQILSPFMVMDNGKQLVSLSATVLCLSDIAGDFINALVIRGGGSVCADYRISAKGGRIGISLRDYCEEFDPMKFNEIHREDNRMSNIGIRMVMSLAKDIRYINTFNSNCLFMYLEIPENGKKTGDARPYPMRAVPSGIF